MNRFNKVVALFLLVALIGAQNTMADSRIDQIKKNTKQFSRDLAIYGKCLRTGKPCDPEIKARLLQDLKVITVGVLAVGGAVVGVRAVKRATDFPVIGSLPGLNIDESAGNLERAIAEGRSKDRAIREWQNKQEKEQKRLMKKGKQASAQYEQDLAARRAYGASLVGEL